MDRSWMYIEQRHLKEFRDGVKGFLIAAEDHMKTSEKEYMFCPCVDCENKKMWRSSVQIQAHLIRRGFMREYTIWTEHGEEGVNVYQGTNVLVDDVGVSFPASNDGDPPNNDVLDEDNDLEQMLPDAEVNFTEREFDHHFHFPATNSPQETTIVAFILAV
ncbi:hypothetical protein ACP4OV_027259 [Aristida adscensionis]